MEVQHETNKKMVPMVMRTVW